VVASDVALALSYTFVLRNLVLLDIAAIAGGFLLRAIVGGVATDVPLSMLFLMVASFGSLFIATGKRYSELRELGPRRSDQRPTLNEYTEPYLRDIQNASFTVAISAYSLWAFEGVAGGSVVGVVNSALRDRNLPVWISARPGPGGNAGGDPS
jgi:decaprenyl-phosphate phosphoribosyltransferase